jgi:SnoaL-like polyketide cyclase
MTTQTASPAANVELLRAGFRAFNDGDTDECLARIAPDLIINLAELPEPQHGRDTWRQGFEMMRHAFPDLQAHIEDIVAAAERSPSGCGSAAPTPASSWASPRPAAPSTTSATSSTGSPTGLSPRNGSARTWAPCCASSAD